MKKEEWIMKIWSYLFVKNEVYKMSYEERRWYWNNLNDEWKRKRLKGRNRKENRSIKKKSKEKYWKNGKEWSNRRL